MARLPAHQVNAVWEVMMTTSTITVNGKPFFGRVEEQKRFRGQPSANRKLPSR